MNEIFILKKEIEIIEREMEEKYQELKKENSELKTELDEAVKIFKDLKFVVNLVGTREHERRLEEFVERNEAV